MKIKKETDGVLWAFNESAPERGWRKVNDEDLDPGEVLTELIKLKQDKKKDLSYDAAFSEIQRENPELTKRFLHQRGLWPPGPSLKEEDDSMKNFDKQHLTKILIENIEEVIKDKRARNPGLTAMTAFQELVRDYPDLTNRIDAQTRAFLLSKLVELTLKDRKSLSYGEAFAEVQTANPQLTIQFQRDLEKKRRGK